MTHRDNEQGLGVAIHVDPDPAAPAADPRLLQRQLLRIEVGTVRPVLAVVDVREIAVQAVAPAVKTAVKTGARNVAAAVVDQASASMLADVVERLDLVGRDAHQQDRLVEDLVVQVVADLGDLFLAARDLPDPGPKASALTCEQVPRGVVRLRNEVGPHPAPDSTAASITLASAPTDTSYLNDSMQNIQPRCDQRLPTLAVATEVPRGAKGTGRATRSRMTRGCRRAGMRVAKRCCDPGAVLRHRSRANRRLRRCQHLRREAQRDARQVWGPRAPRSAASAMVNRNPPWPYRQVAMAGFDAHPNTRPPGIRRA